MFWAYREFYIHGCEDDPTDLTVKRYETIEQAIAYVRRYAKGIRFCSAWVEDEDGTVLFEIVNSGADTYDYRERGFAANMEVCNA